jgi:hypothetical protein
MKMTLRLASPTSLLVLALAAAGCRDRAPAATADPVGNAAPPKPKPAPSQPNPVDVGSVTVTTNKIEIPRAGHDPVVLELPVVKGARDVLLDDKINALLSPEKILGESIDDVRDEAKAVTPSDPGLGVQGTAYEVVYDKHGILQIDAETEFWGAYPSGNRFHVVIDVVKGEPIGAAAFLPARVPALVKRIDGMLKAEVKASPASKDPDFGSLLTDAKFEAKNLGDFSVSDDGITFEYDYQFPHVAQGLQPDGRFLVHWSDVAADLDPLGPLARIHPVP